MSATPDLYIGIMSGTSLDGIDAALVDLSQASPRLISSYFQPYAQPLKDALLALHHASHDELHQSQLIANQLAREYADATLALLMNAGVTAESVQAIGCHGQTVRHRPEHGYTIQLNNAALLAELTGIHVVGDFRSRDIAAGGQGAPLVPAFHDKVLRHPNIHRAILNIGGIANLTDLAPNKATIGFDSGPGNLLMDAWIAKQSGQALRQERRLGSQRQGHPCSAAAFAGRILFRFSPTQEYGARPVQPDLAGKHLNGKETPADVQATLLALTGDSIATAVQRFCKGAQGNLPVRRWCSQPGTGCAPATRAAECRIQKTEVLGIAADWMEAIAFAWLAQQTMHLRPGNLPAVTGAKHPCVLGAIYPA